MSPCHVHVPSPPGIRRLGLPAASFELEDSPEHQDRILGEKMRFPMQDMLGGVGFLYALSLALRLGHTAPWCEQSVV